MREGDTVDYSSTTLVSSQVDWLTATALTGPKAVALEKLGWRLGEAEEQRGMFPGAFSWRGYEGLHCGSITWGSRDDSVILQVSGESAARAIESVSEHATKFTRVDVQVTARMPDTVDDLALMAFGDCDRANLQRGRPYKLTHYVNNEGGSTTYIGAPSSIQRGRIYNKATESKQERWANCWRWEVELKQELATDFAHQLRTAEHTDALCAGLVHGWFSSRGCILPWTSETLITLHVSESAESDIESKLRWLNSQVKPTVTKLRSLGRDRDVLQALGYVSEMQKMGTQDTRSGAGSHYDALASENRDAASITPILPADDDTDA